MKAVILSADKKIIPVYSAEANQDVDMIMVEVKVQFQKDDGTPYLTQTFARRPEDFDTENPSAYFDAQAVAMQSDLDQQASNAGNNEANAAADVIIAALTNK